MRYSELKELIGRPGKITVKPGLEMRVRIVDVRRLYGRMDVLVKPALQNGGRGEAWFQYDSLEMERSNHPYPDRGDEDGQPE